MNAAQIDQPAPGRRTGAARQRKISRGERWYALIITSLVVVAGPGCAVAPSAHKFKNEIHSREDVVATQQQIRLRMRALAEPLSGAIVASADRIIAGTTDRAVQRGALLWKIEGVPAIREALFRPDPYVAVVDTWVLTFQMTDYFESGRGKQALGEAAPIAGKTCQDLESQVNTIAASLTSSGNVSDVQKFARKWAKDHPIQLSIVARESLVSFEAERELPETFSTEHLAGDAAMTLDDLTRRLDVYSVQLFDQARWQAELVTMDLASHYEFEKAMPLGQSAVQAATEAVGILKRLEPALNDTLSVAKSTPELIDRERLATQEYVTREREAALKQLTNEREAMMKDITKEREAITQELRQTVAEERKVLEDDVEKIGARQVDHAVFRVAQLTAASLAAIFVGVTVLIWIARRIFVGRARQ